LLSEFQCVFTVPSFQTFMCVMTGWVLSYRRRFVTELIWSSGSTRRGHHSRHHRFFSQAAWGLDRLCEVLANRKEKAVRRTAPMALVLYSVIVVWFHQMGHRFLQFPDRPWYPRKEEPSFADLLTALRRLRTGESISVVSSIVVRTLRVRKTAHGVCRLLSLRLLLIRRSLGVRRGLSGTSERHWRVASVFFGTGNPGVAWHPQFGFKKPLTGGVFPQRGVIYTSWATPSIACQLARPRTAAFAAKY
jgi:hypothetical protein